MPLATLNTTSLAWIVGGQQVRAGDVVDVDEVHRLGAVAEDQGELAGLDPLDPAHQHLGVDPVDAHPRAVDVEVAQRDIVEPAIAWKLRSRPSLHVLAAP